MCQGFLKKKIVLNTVKIFELFNIFCFLYTAVHFKHDFQNVKFQNEKDNVSKCHYIVALNFSKGWTLRIRTICQATAAITFKDNFFFDSCMYTLFCCQHQETPSNPAKIDFFFYVTLFLFKYSLAGVHSLDKMTPSVTKSKHTVTRKIKKVETPKALNRLISTLAWFDYVLKLYGEVSQCSSAHQ